MTTGKYKMSNVFSKLKNVLVKVAIANSQARLRQQLLSMSNRQLEDYGFSRQLLLEGDSAWPWRTDVVADAVAAGTSLKAEGVIVAPEVVQVAAPKVTKRSIRKAVKELNSYSDRELAELGVNRQSIEEVVRFGRPSVEGVFQNNRSAA